MPVTDALLFIDANKYLDLYRTDNGRKLLGPLTEQAEYIFVTKQVVDEVQRNKLVVAADFLRTKSVGMKLQSINVPDHFSGSASGKNRQILSEMREISKSVATVNAEIDSHTLEIMTQVSESKDEVSKELAPIFSKAVSASSEEFERARERKEVGNPPGKRNDPLGDEITWEQILNHFEGKKRLWIISRDGDYGTNFGGTIFPNGLLKSDLLQITEDASVYIFEDLVKGLTHFVETTKVKAELKLTRDEVIEIEVEEKSLPPLETSAAMQAVIDAGKPFAAMQAMVEAGKPSAAMQAVIDAGKPSAAMQAMVEAGKPSAAMQAVIDAGKPSAAMQAMVEAGKPFAAMQAVIDAGKPFAAMQAVIDAGKPSAVPKDKDKDK